LLDAHSLLWLVTDDLRLSDTARNTFLDADNALLCIAVFGFETAEKHTAWASWSCPSRRASLSKTASATMR
jgi:PIN domain nuclease of toxin-antitoxin system